MRRNFEELRSFLHAHYPALAEAKSVRGELYPPPPFAQSLATFGSYAQMAGVAITLGGSLIFDKLGIFEPFFVPVMRRNPMPTIVGLSFVNYFCSSLSATGAFEVSIDGEVVFSRLAGEGNFPTGKLLLSELEKRGLRSSAGSF
ncbi:unnamed protein product [Pylaiella littoralis]